MDTRFRKLFEVAPDAIQDVDEAGAVRLANEEVARLFGCPRTELIGSRVDELLPERYRGAQLTHRGHYHDHSLKRPMGSDLDLWARKADGTDFPVDIKLSPIQTDDGLRMLASGFDGSRQTSFNLARSRAGAADSHFCV
jgi:PAS domain S-box-containing protein